jgi:hypothetical protein
MNPVQAQLMGPRRVPDLEELYRRDRARRFVAAARAARRAGRAAARAARRAERADRHARRLHAPTLTD